MTDPSHYHDYDPATPGADRIAKLPTWARQHIADLTRERDQARADADEAGRVADAYAAGTSPETSLFKILAGDRVYGVPSDATIVAVVGDAEHGDELDLTVAGTELRVELVTGEMTVRPAGHDIIKIGVRR